MRQGCPVWHLYSALYQQLKRNNLDVRDWKGHKTIIRKYDHLHRDSKGYSGQIIKVGNLDKVTGHNITKVLKFLSKSKKQPQNAIIRQDVSENIKCLRTNVTKLQNLCR